MKLLNLLIMAGILILGTSCGKKKPQPAVTMINAPTTTAEAAAPPTVPNPVTIPTSVTADDPQLLESMTQALRRYALEHRSVPENFDAVVTGGYIRNVPAPPAGKKYGIDTKAVRVVLDAQ